MTVYFFLVVLIHKIQECNCKYMFSLQLSISTLHNIQCFTLVTSLQKMAGKIKSMKSDLFLE